MPNDSVTPSSAWASMVLGNERFMAGDPRHARQDAERRAEVALGQEPRAALFGCSDSRLSAEIIFDLGLGDVFVVRNAGQIISESVLGSLEYAVAVLKVPLIVVLGHDKCGAVLAAIDSQSPDAAVLPPHIARLISKIVPAVRRVSGGAGAGAGSDAGAGAGAGAGGDADGDAGGEIIRDSIDPLAVGREHLSDTISELLSASELISDAIAAGTLAIVGASYRLLEGRVTADFVLGSIDAESVNSSN